MKVEKAESRLTIYKSTDIKCQLCLTDKDNIDCVFCIDYDGYKPNIIAKRKDKLKKLLDKI